MSPLDTLLHHRPLTPSQLRSLLTSSPEEAAVIADTARTLTERVHGRSVLLRGLLEITNRCRNNCYYCGIRAGNPTVRRYLLTTDEIVSAARSAYSLGFRTIVMQGGEHPASDSDVSRAVARIAAEMPDCAVTLSLGERLREIYAGWRRAGASRYLLRHETADAAHYSTLHPSPMTLASRLRCLGSLRAEGFQTGIGMMVGSPGQTTDHLVADLMLIQRFRPEMVGIGPFIPHPHTPFASRPAGSVELTLRLISIIRLMLPSANIPSTTALATLSPDGRERGILAGANVVMPNVTPACFRADYSLYSGKASSGAEGAEGLALLSSRLEKIGRFADFSRGDFKPYTRP